jgi:phage-related protein
MSAAADSPLAGATPALATFNSRLTAATGALRNSVAGFGQAASAVDRIRTAAQQDTVALSEAKEKAAAAETSLARTGQTAGTAGGGLKGATTSIRSTKGSLTKLAMGTGAGLMLLAQLDPALGPITKIMTTLGTALFLGSIAITAVNTVMKGNPIGFVTGVLLPLAGYLIDLALNSQTGQKVMQQVSGFVMKQIPALLTIMGPVLKAVAVIVATYFTAYMTVIVDVLKVVGALISGAFTVVHALVTGDTSGLKKTVSGVWNGFKAEVSKVTGFLTKDLPGAFTRVKGAVSSVLNGAGGFVETAMQAVAGALKAPVQGLIGFANMVIGGLDKIHFSFFGKKFGVHIPKIPMLAEGGVVLPPVAQRAARVLPLTALDRQLALAAGRSRTAPTGTAKVGTYRERAGLGARGTAEDLLFLAATRACA